MGAEGTQPTTLWYINEEASSTRVLRLSMYWVYPINLLCVLPFYNMRVRGSSFPGTQFLALAALGGNNQSSIRVCVITKATS